MYRTCLHCTRDLGKNDVLESLPIGRRIAFDPARGRLWVVCRSCAKWNLVPFDNRLEAIDDCARLFHDTRTRFSTDNIGMARLADGLELVRIGAPQLPEFASWRYGAQYRRRRRVNIAIGGASLLGTSAANIALTSLFPVTSMAVAVPASAAVLFGVMAAANQIQSRLQRVLATVPGTSGVMKIDADHALSAHLAMVDGEMTVSWSPSILAALRKRKIAVSGPEGRLLTRRILGLANRNVGSAKHLGGAVERIEAGGVDRWLSRLTNESTEFLKMPQRQRLRMTMSMMNPWLKTTGHPVRHAGFDSQSFALASLPWSDRLAIEMWLSEEDEARALAGELSLLERQWQEAERLAAIADGLSLEAEQSLP